MLQHAFVLAMGKERFLASLSIIDSVRIALLANAVGLAIAGVALTTTGLAGGERIFGWALRLATTIAGATALWAARHARPHRGWQLYDLVESEATRAAFGRAANIATLVLVVLVFGIAVYGLLRVRMRRAALIAGLALVLFAVTIVPPTVAFAFYRNNFIEVLEPKMCLSSTPSG
jgi:hypothetical protein